MNIPKINIAKKPEYIKFGEDIDFFNLFENIEQQFDTCFIFESLGEEGKFSRYSVIGFDPPMTISAKNNSLRISSQIYPVSNPYFALRKIMPPATIARDYMGGLVGYLSYEAVNYFEPAVSLKTHPMFDQFLFGVYTDGLILDKDTNELFYFYYHKNRSRMLKKLLGLTPRKAAFQACFIKDSLTKKQHADMVERTKDDIKAGNIFQCEVGFKSEYEIQGDTLTIYDRLRKINPSPFMYYLKFGQKKIIGASPELLFSLRGKDMTTRPLAGSASRGKNNTADIKVARDLLNDPKEKAEHNMLIDLHRNDLGRVAQFGTIRIRELAAVRKFKYVQHISSEITGLIKKGEDQFSGLAASFPAGTLTGAPKIAAMKIINRHETQARGPYGGGVGHFGFNGDSTFAIAIRSLFVSGNYAFTQTSGGIVYDSQADKEYEEIQNKLAGMKEVLT